MPPWRLLPWLRGRRLTRDVHILEESGRIGLKPIRNPRVKEIFESAKALREAYERGDVERMAELVGIEPAYVRMVINIKKEGPPTKDFAPLMNPNLYLGQHDIYETLKEVKTRGDVREILKAHGIRTLLQALRDYGRWAERFMANYYAGALPEELRSFADAGVLLHDGRYVLVHATPPTTEGLLAKYDTKKKELEVMLFSPQGLRALGRALKNWKVEEREGYALLRRSVEDHRDAAVLLKQLKYRFGRA